VLYQTYKVTQEGGYRNAAILTDEQLLKSEPLGGLEWDRSVRWRDLHFVCSDEQRLNARSYAKIVAEGRAGLCTRVFNMEIFRCGDSRITVIGSRDWPVDIRVVHLQVRPFQRQVCKRCGGRKEGNWVCALSASIGRYYI
jgi:hypothetical protein